MTVAQDDSADHAGWQAARLPGDRPEAIHELEGAWAGVLLSDVGLMDDSGKSLPPGPAIGGVPPSVRRGWAGLRAAMSPKANGKLTDYRLDVPGADIRTRVDRTRELDRQRFYGATGSIRGEWPF